MKAQLTKKLNHLPSTIYHSQSGQVVLVLLLVMLVGLTVGLAITQRSLSDVSISTKSEQSSRAFSAAEAGIEKALQTGVGSNQPDLGNQSNFQVTAGPPTPAAAGEAIEYPVIDKDTVAQVWFIPPNSNLSNPPTVFYNGDVGHNYHFNLYFGYKGLFPVPTGPNPPAQNIADSNYPAIELTLVTYDATNHYATTKFYFDPIQQRAITNNNFTNVSGSCNGNQHPASSPSGTDYFCKILVNVINVGNTGIACNSPGCVLVLARVRLLYTTSLQPFAIEPQPATSQLPTQAQKFTSTGVSGQSQKQLEVLRVDKVVPGFFDYALFANSSITKQ